MTALVAKRLALGVWIATCLLYVAALALTVGRPWMPTQQALWVTAGFGFATIGGLIGVRQPANRIGGLFLGAGALLLVQSCTYGYAAAALLGGMGLPGPELAAWASLWTAVPGITAVLVFLPLLFPNGRLLSPRWRPVAWFSGLMLVLATLGLAVDSGPFPDLPFENPFAIPSLAGFSTFMAGDGFLLAAAAMTAGLVSLGLRTRRAQGVERQQLKWFAYSFILLGLFIVVQWVVVEELLGLPPHPVSDAVGVAFMLAVPASVAIAVLRYRLYDIDRILSRTVAYALLTGLLVSIYVGGVLLLGRFLAPLTAGSDVAVAASTLLVAALFQPLRRSVQTVVDRRFNRARYDAQRAVEVFAARLRNDVDLDDLSEELTAVVHRTVAPVSVSVWLAGTDGGRS